MAKPKQPVEWTENQQACIDALAVFARGIHHVYGLKPFGSGVSITWYGDLSTTDDDSLTRLVMVAHKCAVRFTVTQGGPGSVKIVAFKRQHGDKDKLRFCEIHPNLTDLAVETLLWRY